MEARDDTIKKIQTAGKVTRIVGLILAILGFVAVKDDGMELSLGLHMANNIIAAITITSDSSTLQTHALFKDLHPTASHFDTMTMLVAGVIFIWICNRKYHFWGKICLWKKIQKESNEM